MNDKIISCVTIQPTDIPWHLPLLIKGTKGWIQTKSTNFGQSRFNKSKKSKINYYNLYFHLIIKVYL